MSNTLTAVVGAANSTMKIARALLSVSDKTGLVELGKALAGHGVELLSTGGTAKVLRQAGLTVQDVSDYTGFPEMMDGRVKSLHPKIHGGLLGVRGNPDHEKDMADNGVKPIDLVVLNLYPFEAAVAKGSDFDTCIENIDIGGPSMLRSSAKNHKAVTVVTSPNQYAELLEELSANDGATSYTLRRRFAATAFALSASYDASISSWFGEQVGDEATAITRTYVPETPLRYGCNPHQTPAFLSRVGMGAKFPFEFLNGAPGYINMLDAVNAWQLVCELKQATGLPAATSFKHVSPAGAAVAVPLSGVLVEAYEATGKDLSPLALAYLRARNADPMSSFGDFAALSEVCDEATALLLKVEVSDGVVAPGYEPAALEILKKKKGGKFLVLQADTTYEPPALEFRECFGVGFTQKRNTLVSSKESLTDVVTELKELPESAVLDLLVANVTLKYTQSNSVGYALGGQMIGVGAGQQSRVDCVKLAGRKVSTWYLRQCPKVLGLKFKAGVKRQDRVNARVRYIEGDMTPAEHAVWAEKFEEVPEPLTEAEKRDWLSTLEGVGLASDAFFPFRDSLDVASQVGVKYIVQPGGSVADEQVVGAANEYGMAMAMTKTRLFHH